MAASAADGFTAAIGPIEAIGKLMEPMTAAQPAGTDDNAKQAVRQLATATRTMHRMDINGAAIDTWRTAAGMELVRVMRRNNHGLTKLPVLSSDPLNATRDTGGAAVCLPARRSRSVGGDGGVGSGARRLAARDGGGGGGGGKRGRSVVGRDPEERFRRFWLICAEPGK